MCFTQVEIIKNNPLVDYGTKSVPNPPQKFVGMTQLAIDVVAFRAPQLTTSN
jgi:hypothetical protein